MTRFLPAFFVALAALTLPAAAEARDDSQLWTSASANLALGGNWRLTQEVTARFSENRDGLYELEAVTLLGYRVGKSVTLALGYVHNPLYAAGDFTAMEHRAREQITFDNVAKIGSGKLSARLRVEQRWRENQEGTAWRLRPYLKYALPLRGKTALVLSNETFINLKSTAFQKADGLDRMRNFIAISTPLATNLNVEAGYLNQYGFVRNGEDSMDHVASLSVTLSM